jgi:hypothetical protein
VSCPGRCLTLQGIGGGHPKGWTRPDTSGTPSMPTLGLGSQMRQRSLAMALTGGLWPTELHEG